MTLALIQDLLLILTSGFIACLVCRYLRVSVLIGYLIAGVLLGPGALGLVSDEEHQVAEFAEAGVFLLLFAIGLEFSLDDARRLGAKLFVAGASQMLLVAVPTGLLLVSFGWTWAAAILLAAAISFSSTVLVFKALSEQGQSEKPHGMRAIGILLFQDAALIPLLLLIPLLSGEAAADFDDYLWLAIVSLLFIAAVVVLRYALSTWIIPAFAQIRSPELVILFCVVMLGGFTLSAFVLGLPPAVGAFAAGLIFNGNRWTQQIDALVMPFRETFAAIFFVSLGLILKPSIVLDHPVATLGGVAAVVLLKSVAAASALRLTGLSPIRSIGMGIGLAHIGEFAFVLALFGNESGIIGESDYQRLVAVAIGTLLLTPSLMQLGLRLIARDQDEVPGEQDGAVSTAGGIEKLATVVGAGPTGRQIASRFETIGYDVCLIDRSSLNLHPFALAGFRTVAGDATDRDTLRHARADESETVVICVPDDATAFQIVRETRRFNTNALLIVRCRFHSNVQRLVRAGADRVVSEEFTASLALLDTLRHFHEDRP